MTLPHEEAQKGGKSGQGTQPGDEGTIATFYKHPVYMKYKSDQEGRPIYQDFDFISLQCSAQKHSVSTRKVTEADKKRFPHIWEAFVNDQEVKETGTAIENLPDLTGSQVLMLRGVNVPTIEALAAVPDGNANALGPGGLDLKKRAKLFLEGESENSVKLEEANSRIADLEEKIEALMAVQAEAAANPAPKKRGRPKKNVAADDSTRHAE